MEIILVFSPDVNTCMSDRIKVRVMLGYVGIRVRLF